MFSSIRHTSSLLRSHVALRSTPKYFSTSAAPAIDIGVPYHPPPVKKDASNFAMTPKEVVGFLDEYIIGQSDAKRAVAVAFRNRWRRQRLPVDIKNDVSSSWLLHFTHRLLLSYCRFSLFCTDYSKEYIDDRTYWLWKN